MDESVFDDYNDSEDFEPVPIVSLAPPILWFIGWLTFGITTSISLRLTTLP